MASWQQVGVDNYRDGLELLSRGGSSYRSAVSRFYYAVFALLTDELVRRGARREFMGNRDTPGHAQLPGLVEKHLTHLGNERLRHLIGYARSLYRNRIAADYSLLRLHKRAAIKILRATEKVFQYLGVDHE